MDLKSSKSNTINVSYTAAGEKQYSVNFGTILYNNYFMTLNSIVIPFSTQIFFNLPDDKNKYAVINVYYDVKHKQFIFDKLGVFDKYIKSLTAKAIPNALPIAQFTVQQAQNSFDIISYNEYSQMSTFTITDSYVKGETGIKAYQGETGAAGISGLIGYQGYTGPTGPTGAIGPQGFTGLSYTGPIGNKGVTGIYIDKDLLLYLKFKTDDRRQSDYSPYERDCYYTFGDTYYNGLPLSRFIKEPGVVDSCHEIIYGGGLSAYRRNEFIEFGRETGTISAWIKLTEKPKADFTYTVDISNPLMAHFKDTSIYEPISWTWWVNCDPSYAGEETGDVFTTNHFTYTFYVPGTYIVKLRATNLNGYTDITKFVII
jgi:hypothetical protein